MSSRPAPAARPRTTEPGAAGRLPALTARGVALAVVALVSVGSVLGPARTWVEQRSDLSALRADVAAREQRVAGLQADSQRWDDPAYAASQARARLQYVVPGETRYAVLGAPASASPDAALPTAAASPEPTSLLGQLRAGLGLGGATAPTATPTPADIAPSSGAPAPTATPVAS